MSGDMNKTKAKQQENMNKIKAKHLNGDMDKTEAEQLGDIDKTEAEQLHGDKFVAREGSSDSGVEIKEVTKYVGSMATTESSKKERLMGRRLQGRSHETVAWREAATPCR